MTAISANRVWRMKSVGGKGTVSQAAAKACRRSCLIVIVCLIAGGASYRLAMGQLRPLMTERIILPAPLKNIPGTIGDWDGVDVPLSPEVVRIAGNDDYVNRRYTLVSGSGAEKANFYIGYCGRPRAMVGHRPRVCYVNAGWVHGATEEVEVELSDGRVLECLVHSFHLPSPRFGQVFVLNYYVLNGHRTRDVEDFSGVGWRLPNLAGDPAWYVAQVQISSVSRSVALRLAATTADIVLLHLPDEQGRVRAAENHQPGEPRKGD